VPVASPLQVDAAAATGRLGGRSARGEARGQHHDALHRDLRVLAWRQVDAVVAALRVLQQRLALRGIRVKPPTPPARSNTGAGMAIGV
jgi:hypothetical protein